MGLLQEVQNYVGVQEVLQGPLFANFLECHLVSFAGNNPPDFPFKSLGQRDAYEAFSSSASAGAWSFSKAAKASVMLPQLPKKPE